MTFLWQGQFWLLGLLYGKKVKQWIFSDSVVACEIKVDLYSQLNELL